MTIEDKMFVRLFSQILMILDFAFAWFASSSFQGRGASRSTRKGAERALAVEEIVDLYESRLNWEDVFQSVPRLTNLKECQQNR